MKPKLCSILQNRKKELTVQQLRKDILSGIIVAIIALPLSVALAIASGVTPQQGLITAIVAGALISLFGGSRVQIGGPTGAFVIIICGIINKYGMSGLTIATVMAGCMMVIMGVFRLGNLIKYIPYTITTGFTTGIAFVLITTQVKDFLGLSIKEVPDNFFGKWSVYAKFLDTFSLPTLAVGMVSLLILIFWPKINKTVPPAILALVVSTLLVNVLHLPVETIGSRFGEIKGQIKLMDLSNMSVDIAHCVRLFRPALTIACLASLESLLSAVVADGMIGKKHDSNMELIGQGIANMGSAFFGGIPATGAIARTAANVRNGGRTPIAGLVHSIVLFIIMLLFMPLAGMIPMTVLAAILIMVAYNMSELHTFFSFTKSTKSDLAVLLVTFSLTVIMDLVVAIGAGMVLSMFFFMQKMSQNKVTENMVGQKSDKNENIEIYKVNGPLFFGVATGFMEVISEMDENTKVVIFCMQDVKSLDATALNTMRQLYQKCRSKKILILFTNLNEQPMKLIQKSKFMDQIGRDRFFNELDEAFNQAYDIVSIAKEGHKLKSAS